MGLIAKMGICVFAAVSCNQQRNNLSKNIFGVDIKGDTLIVNSLSGGVQTLSYSISGKPFLTKGFSNSIRLDITDLIKGDVQHVNEFAYTVATKGNLPIRFMVGEQLDTTIRVSFQVTAPTKSARTRIVSGPCLKLDIKGTSNSQEVEIKKWLFKHGTHADDATIHRMAQVVNILSASGYDEYVPEEENILPVLKNFRDARFKIQTDIKADYYYLYAASEYSEINDFIAEEVSLNFQHAEKSPSAPFACFRPLDKGGILTIFFIAINKDWSRTIVPLGLVVIDNQKPYISSDNKTSFGGDVSFFSANSAQTSESDKKLIKEINASISFPKNRPVISGSVHIATGQFRGDDAQFTITFSGDVESMTIKREVHRSYSWLTPGTKTINFSGQTSPMHFTYALDLGIGDNYIPITVKDKRGNISTYSYHIEMVQVEKTNPEINIDNNIDIWN